jgi:hypothetical protein
MRLAIQTSHCHVGYEEYSTNQQSEGTSHSISEARAHPLPLVVTLHSYKAACSHVLPQSSPCLGLTTIHDIPVSDLGTSAADKD